MVFLRFRKQHFHVVIWLLFLVVIEIHVSTWVWNTHLTTNRPLAQDSLGNEVFEDVSLEQILGIIACVVGLKH